VKYRLKTLTGTIPIYDDMTEEQVEDVKRKHGLLPGTFPECIPPPPPGEEGAISPSQMEEADYEMMEASSTTFMSTSSSKVKKQSTTTSVTNVQQESSSHQEQHEHMESYSSSSATRTRKKISSSSKETSHLASTQKDARVSYVAIEGYTPDDYDGLPVTPGQKVFLLNKDSPNKKARLEGSDDISTGERPQLLDNSLAKHKASIRPKKNHPDSRFKGHVQQTSPEPTQAQDTSSEERWFVQDFDTGREGWVPARVLEVSKQAAVVSSIKRSVAELSGDEAVQMKQQMLAQIREFRSKRPSRTLGPTPEDEARAKRTATIQELIETEEEFVRDLKFATNKYVRLMDDPSTPYHIREHKDIIFNNFRNIADFHEK
ncbi:unnamed protein product, partial [Meganyctiphanes norvegica]